MHTKLPRHIFFSFLLVLLWLGFLAQGTHALLSSTATLTASSFTTGSANLLISTDQSANAALFASSRPGFTFSGIPGQTDSKFLTLENTSPSNVPLDITVSGNPQDTPGTLLAQTQLAFTPVDSTGKVTGAPIYAQIADLFQGYTNLKVTIPAGGQQRFRLDSTVSPSYAESSQEGSYDLMFTGTQHYVPPTT